MVTEPVEVTANLSSRQTWLLDRKGAREVWRRSALLKNENYSVEIWSTEKSVIPLAEQDATFCDGYRFIGIFRIS